MIVIKQMQWKILSALGKYKFLTARQMSLLKIGAVNRLYIELRDIEKAGLISNVQHGVGVMKTEKLHFLTLKGAKTLIEGQQNISEEDVKFPKSGTALVKNDLYHRISFIDTQIAYHKWIEGREIETEFFDSYLDSVGSMRNSTNGFLRPKTRVNFDNGKFADPDGILSYTYRDKQRLYIVETYNGNDSKRVYDQLKKMSPAIIGGFCAMKYELEIGVRVLSTFDHEPNMVATMKRMVADPYFQKLRPFYLFQTAVEVHKDFNTWVDMDGQVVSLESL